MIGASAAGASASADPRLGNAWLAGAIPALVLVGYAISTEPRLAGAAVGVLVLAAWGLFALARPRLALSLSLPLLLFAGTKFRHRDADETLAGAVDTQILFELLMFAFIGVAVLAAALKTRLDRRLAPGEAWIGAYTGIALLSTLWSAAPALTLVRGTQLMIIAGLAILAVRTWTPPGALWVSLRALIWYVLICAVIAATLPWTVVVFPDEGVFRFRWFAVHPLEVALLTGCAAITALGVIACARTPQAPNPGLAMRLLWIGFVVVLVLTSSRGPLVALIAGIGMLWLMKMRLPLRAAAILVALAAALTCVVYLTDLRSWMQVLERRESVATRMLLRTQTVDDVFQLNGRLELWTDLAPVVIDHAVIGTGYQASRAIVLEAAEWAAYAHNAFIQTVLDLGVVGLVSVLGLLVLGLRAGGGPGNPIWVRVTVPALVVFLALNAMSNESFSAAPDIELLLVFLCALCGASRRPARSIMPS